MTTPLTCCLARSYLPVCVKLGHQPVTGLGAAFASVDVEREFNIAKSMCGSLLTNLRQPPRVTMNTGNISLTLKLFNQNLFVFCSFQSKCDFL